MVTEKAKKLLNDELYDVRSGKRSRTVKKVLAFVFAVIPLAGFVLFSIFPLIVSFLAMFFDIDLYDLSDISWNNFEGFKYVFVPDYDYNFGSGQHIDSFFLKSLGITFWVASTQLVTLFIALVVSIMLAQKLRGSKVFQVLFFLPYICSTVAVAYMWGQIFKRDGGILNTMFGMDVNWQDADHLTWTIIIATIWQAPGYGIVMYKAALGNVNTSLYEAADLDGANRLQKIRLVTLPAIAPTTYYLLICGVGAGLLTFDLAKLMAGAGHINIAGEDNMGLTFMYLIYWLVDGAKGGAMKIDGSGPASYLSAAAVITWLVFAMTAVFNVFLFNKREKSME